MFPILFWILAAVSAVLCGIGFYRFVWFMSVGYGLAIAGIGVTLGIASIVNGQFGIAYLVMCVLMVVYGCRLGLFLLIRETKNAAYRKTLDAQTKPVPIFVQVAMWLMMALLYPCQTSAAMYRLTNGKVTMVGDVFSWIGAAVMLIGILMEAEADKQKSAAKKINPKAPAMDGLYKLCRCPNYFGEILFWTGLTISGLNILSGAQWVIALIGYVCIVYIMFSGAKRLEKRQNKNYGSMPEYRAYADKTPILIPFVPIYHLVKEEK